MADNPQYKIELGVKLDTSDLQSQVNRAGEGIKPIDIKVDAETKELTNTIKEALNSLSKGTKNALTLDTSKLEASLNDVTSTIREIKTAIGALDSGSNMKSLVSSINSISTALDKASNKFDGLLTDLKSLSGKDFSLNFGINLGSSNSVARQGVYGSKVRSETLPQLRQQVGDLVKYYNDTYKESLNEFEALQKMVSGTKLNSGDFFENFLFGKDSVASRMGGGSLSSQMQAYKAYIDMFKQAASLKGIDLSSVTSGFAKSADDLIKEAQDIQTGAKEMDESFEKLKQVFGGGSNLNIEGISASLEPIVTDLNQIREAVVNLSKGVSLEGLTQSFDRLSDTIEKLVSNVTLAKAALGDGFGNISSASSSNNAITAAQQTGQKIGEVVSKSAQQALNIDDVIDEQVMKLMNEYAITGSKAFDEIRQSLVDFRNGSGDINKITSAISNNMKVVNEAKDDYKDLAEYIKMFNASGAKVHIQDSIRQEYGDDYKSMRSQLGKGFTSGQGMDFETFVTETNEILGQTIDLSQGAEAAFGDLVNKVNSTKGSKFLTGDDLFKNGILDMGDVIANVSTSLGKIEDVEEEIARTSTSVANTVVKNEERKQQAYQETTNQYNKITKDTSLVRDNADFRKDFYATSQAAQEAQIHFQELLADEKAVVSVTERFDDSNALKSFVVDIKRANGEVETLRYAMEDFSQYTGIDDDWRMVYQGGSTSDGSVEKQLERRIKKANDLQIQLDKIKSSYSDMGAAKPIKDADHIEALSQQYDKVVAAITDVRNADNTTSTSMISNAEKEKAVLESMVKEFRNAENVASKMKSTDFSSGLDIAKNDLDRFKAQARNFPQITATIKDLDRAIEGVGDAASLNKFNDQLRVARSELAKVKAEVLSNNDDLVQKIRIDIETEKFDNQMSLMHDKLNSLSDVDGSLDGLRASIQQVENAYDKMYKAAYPEDGVIDNDRLAQAQREYAAAVEKTNNELKIQAREQRAANAAEKLADNRAALRSDMLNWLQKNSKATKEYKAEIDRLILSLDKLDEAGIKGARRKFKNIDKDAELKGLKGLNFIDSMKSKIKEYSVYFGAAEMFMYAEQGLRSMFEQVKLIDSAMTELKKVTNETDAAYDKFLTNAADRAKAIGTTIDGLVSSTADFARLGYGFEDAQGLAEVANIYAVVGDEINGVEGATESLISTMSAFKDSANGMSNSDFAMSIIDKFNEIGNNFAISSGGIGEALERSASSLMAANNTIDESIALITAANTVVQDPEAVGTAFKTISMRIRGAKTELEEAGLETEGMVDSTAKLRSEILALTGVDIMDGANQFKSTYAIMDELAQKWEDLTDIQQATVTELIAGKRQGNIVSSLMTNFDTAREALDTSMNSAGSAMKEHEKWQQSLEAQINKLKASWQGLSQAFLKSDFLHGALDAVIGLVDGLTNLIDKVGALPTILGVFAGYKGVTKWLPQILITAKQVGGIQKLADILPLLSLSFPKAAAGANTFGAAIRAMFAAMTAHPIILAITVAIGALVSTFAYQSKKAKELAEDVDELTESYKQNHEELRKLKGDYDASNEDSMISRYEKLSKGVNHLGENVSLTSEEYSEYQSIVNQIAEQIPSLVSGYDSQGNALLSVKGNVEELTAAYEKLIHSQNQSILTKSGDIEKDFKNTVEDADGYGFWEFVGNTLDIRRLWGDYSSAELKGETVRYLEDVLTADEDELDKLLDGNYLDSLGWDEIRRALRESGVELDFWGDASKGLKETLKNDPQKIQNIIDNYYAQFEDSIEEKKTIAQAKLSEAFDISSAISGLNYDNITEELQSIARQTVANLDFDFFTELQENGKTVEQWTTEMLDQLNAISTDDSAKISSAFDLQTQFNGGEISYGEFVKGLEDTGKLVEGLGLEEEVETQLKLSLGLDEEGFVAGYKKLKNRLASEEYFDIMPSDYVPFIESLSSEELSVLWEVIPELEATDYKEDISDIKAALEKEMMLQGLSFELNLEVEAAGLEALNTALAESVSATGLSSESITALKGRYADLESQGYDLSSMFEETSTGIRLNRQEFNKLENAYATEKLAEVDGELTEMKLTYDDLGEAIKNCDDPIKKSELFNDRQTLAKRISEAATLAHQYKGLTNAYNDWLSAEAAGQERDMYENVIKGFETIDDEISRGWIDDGTIEFLELLTGRTDLAGKSGKQLKEIYDGLDDSIKNTTYSIRDFFTVDEDGNSTNTGVYNFLDAIGQLEEEKFGGKDVVKRDKDGNVIGFDFELAGGDEVIAEALGVSEELVQIMVRAADDAGFVVSMDGTYRQLADLQNEAKAAADYLHQIGKTDFEFDFNTTSVENLKTQLEEAHKILDDKKFWNKDGTFNFNADGATQAMQVVSTLQAKLDKLTEDKYGIGLTVEDEEFEEPLENLQEYGRKVATLNQLELNPKANSEEIEELEGELDDIAEYFANLDGEFKTKLGFEADDGVEEVKKKIESGEVKIPTVLDIQANMDKNIETLADLALLNSGLLSENEEETIRKKYSIEVEADEVDTSDVEEKVDNALNGGGGRTSSFGGGRSGSFAISRETNVEIIAETFGIEDVDNLNTKLKGLDDKTVEAIAKAVGKIQVDELKQAVAMLKPNEVEAIAKAIGRGDVVELSDIIGQLSPKTVDAIANALGYDNVNDLRIAVESLDPKTVEAVANALGITDVESLKGAIDNLQPKTVEVEATTSGESKLSGLKSIIDSIKSKTVTITSWFKKIVSGGSTRNDSNGFNEVDGTANVNGTTGRAFKQGSWGTKNSGTALVGELGAEVLVRDGRYYTIGDNGAEFIKYKKGDIIFNHLQTEELFKNGRVTAGGGHAKSFASGTAFATGSSGIGGIGKVTALTKDNGKKKKITKTKAKAETKSTNDSTTTTTTTTTTTSNGSTGSGSGGSGKVEGNAVGTDKDKKEFEEVFDWIEIAISRIEREIDNLDRTANNIYKSWSDRNKALAGEISKVSEEIKLQNDAAAEYLKEANSVGLDESWAKKVREGAIDISTLNQDNSSEELIEKIKDYQKWYELYLACTDAAEELREEESKLYAQRFENVQSQYNGILQGYEHTESMLNEYISQAEAQGNIVSEKYYNALIENEKQNINTLKREQNALIAERDKAVAEGKIVKGSEAWYDMCSEIDSVTQAIEEGTTSLIEYDNAIRDIDWQIFDLIQEKISDITAESEFLIELMSNKKLFDDKGKLTEQGAATLGLHGQNYNAYMYQADDYGKEVAEIDKQIAKDPYDQELINRRRELIELQRESILSAEDEKNAIKDLVEEGINLELDALQERIDLHNEELDSMKDLYDYQKNVEEQTENIASLRKQIGAYDGFDDDETRAKVQELKVSLEEAEADLQETEYDKFISDQTVLLDTLYTEYETILNSRLDNIDLLLQGIIDGINAAAGEEGAIATALGSSGAIASAIVSAMGENGTIKTILNSEANNVGTTLSTAMNNIWSVGDGNAKSVLTKYGDGFQNQQTTTNATLNNIKADVAAMVDDVDKESQKKVAANKTSTSAKKDPTKDTKKTTKPTTNNNANKSYGDGKAKVGDKVKFVSGKYYYDSQGKKPLGSHNLGKEVYITSINTAKWATHPYHISTGKKLGTGDLGWLKLSQLSGYATGKKKISNNEYAWTQENGQEYIIRPSDGAILTPVAKGDSVLNAAASGNIWSIANNPAEFIKDNLGLDAANIPNGANVNNNVTQHFENINFHLPNVHSYNELITEMQRDPKFEKLILAMTVEQIAGKSKLGKNKAIR